MIRVRCRTGSLENNAVVIGERGGSLPHRQLRNH